MMRNLKERAVEQKHSTIKPRNQQSNDSSNQTWTMNANEDDETYIKVISADGMEVSRERVTSQHQIDDWYHFLRFEIDLAFFIIIIKHSTAIISINKCLYNFFVVLYGQGNSNQW